MKRSCWVVFVGVILARSPLWSQDPPGDATTPSPINTDRPAFTDSSVVVPAGSLQFENGFLETAAEGQRSFDFPETAIRLGIASKTELRLSAPDYYQNYLAGAGFGSGWGDLLVGLKQQLGPTPGGFDVSLVLAVSLPTGAKSILSHGYDPEIELPWSRALSKNWTAAGMLSAYWPTQGAARNVTGQTTFELDRQITKVWDGFVEYAGNFPQRGGPAHILHFGTAYKIASNQQLDFHVGVGLSAAAPDHFFGFGYSFRVQAFRR